MNKLKDIESMRVIAMILVVFAHVTRMYTVNAAIPQGVTNSFITALTEWIYTFHMPAFVAISGAVYYFVKRERKAYNNTLIFIKNKATRLLIPYIFFAIVVVLPTLWYCNLIEGNFWKYNFDTFIMVKEPRHLWYLIMLFNLLVLINFCEKYIFKYKMIVLLLTLLIHPFAYHFPIKIFQFHNIIFYSLYFMIGYCFQHKRRDIVSYLNRINKPLIFISLTLSMILIYSIYYIFKIHYAIVSLSCSILGILLLYIASIMFSQIEKNTNSILFKLIDKNNFGLYLFHPMIIYIIFYNIKGLNIHPWVSILLVFISSTIISIALTEFMRAIGLKTFIGEK